MKIRPSTPARDSALRLWTLFAIALACTLGAPAAQGEPSEQAREGPVRPSDPWQASQVVKPEDLAASLSKAAADKPLLLYVGPRFPYLGGHIAGSIFAGPASKTDGLEALKTEVKDLPRDKPIVLYCGCCPWKDCPNIRPAFRALQDMEFRNVRVLYLPTNLRQDWIDKGWPAEKGDGAR
jgi:thiosulfate/3-mercaptopyruvate sulfurtransferase